MNAWALFDDVGAVYAGRAVHSGEYPSLYRLSIPARDFEPFIAEGLPSAVTPDGAAYTASVRLKPGLYWSDGSPLTAQDVAFTASTALAFRLRLDWASAYNPEVLERVDATDERTVSFHFKGPFTVADWQYGALQGPILSRLYWEPRLAGAEALLPSADLTASVDKTRLEAASVQALIEADTALLRLTPPNSESYKEVSGRLNRNQNELNSLNARTAKLQDEYDAALDAARASLFALADDGEPVFGPFLRATQKGNLYTRPANPSWPFERPAFDSLSYALYPSQDSAVLALEKGQVDVILDPRGLPPELVSDRLQKDPSLVIAGNSTRSARFLVLDPLNAPLADPALRQALTCILDRAGLARSLNAVALDSFVLPGNGSWSNSAVSPTCARGAGAQAAVEALKLAGYRWNREPSGTAPGEGLTRPDGSAFPSLTLLAPSAETDAQRLAAADLVAASFARLGINVTIKPLGAEELRYSVFSTGEYDMALLGWQLSDYPAYLCDWFESPSAFALPDAAVADACRTLRSTADLETAKQAVYHLQSILAGDLPFIPLYQEMHYEAWRGIAYPFQFVPDGLSGLYGAPGMAVPAP